MHFRQLLRGHVFSEAPKIRQCSRTTPETAGAEQDQLRDPASLLSRQMRGDDPAEREAGNVIGLARR